jgi:DNA-binding CsgD family transcriptional regulator
MEEASGIVLLAAVASTRRSKVDPAAWLRDLAADLDRAYGEHKLAAFEPRGTDELQGLLAPDADPLMAVLRAGLTPAAVPMRWLAVRGAVERADEGAAGETSGARPAQATLAATRAAMDEARLGHQRLVLRTGVEATDTLLADLAPVLADLLIGLTPRQQTVARLALLDGLRQSEVAARLGVRRATISVSFSRARVHSLQRQADAIRRLFAAVEQRPEQSQPAVVAAPASGARGV